MTTAMSTEWSFPESETTLGTPKAGVDYELEEQADALLAQARRDLPKDDEDPYEVLSPGQLERRRSREIYNANGVPEPHLFSGIYRRADNPLIRDRVRKSKSDEE